MNSSLWVPLQHFAVTDRYSRENRPLSMMIREENVLKNSKNMTACLKQYIHLFDEKSRGQPSVCISKNKPEIPKEYVGMVGVLTGATVWGVVCFVVAVITSVLNTEYS